MAGGSWDGSILFDMVLLFFYGCKDTKLPPRKQASCVYRCVRMAIRGLLHGHPWPFAPPSMAFHASVHVLSRSRSRPFTLPSVVFRKRYGSPSPVEDPREPLVQERPLTIVVWAAARCAVSSLFSSSLSSLL